MSRIGKLPVVVPDNVNVKIEGNNIEVSGPLGKLDFNFSTKVSVKLEEKNVIVSILDQDSKALWGTTRSVISNMVEGVNTGYKKSLEINGVGYKFEVSGTKIILSIGYSHKVDVEVPEGLKAQLDEKQKNVLYISGIDKQLVGQFASKVKFMKKPEPYKGKGIKYVGEQIRRKAGKTGKK